MTPPTTFEPGFAFTYSANYTLTMNYTKVSAFNIDSSGNILIVAVPKNPTAAFIIALFASDFSNIWT